MTCAPLRHARPASLLAGLLAALLVGACGDPPGLPPSRDHDLKAEPLPAEPAGEALALGGAFGPGTWVGRMRMTVADRSAGRPERAGEGVLVVRQEVRERADALRSHVTLSVESATEGLGADLLAGLNGVAYTVDHDRGGRPVAGTVRFLGDSPQNAAFLLDGLAFAGFGGCLPWLPEEPVRVGGTWSLDASGLRRAIARSEAAQGVLLPVPRVTGGARLEALEPAGARVAAVRVEQLTEVVGPVGGGRISLGHLARGEGRFDAETGLPLSWRIEERLQWATSGDLRDPPLDRTMAWEGVVRVESEGERGPPGADR